MSVNPFNRYFLVDYENVNVAGLNGIDKLSAADSVSIFFSENAQSLTFEYHKKINEAEADIDLIMAESGEKNALDFQLSSYLGFIISEHLNYFPDEAVTYCIISKDKGYKPLVNFWSKKAVIKQYTDLAMTLTLDDYYAELTKNQNAMKKAMEDGINIPEGCLLKGNDVNFILNSAEGNIKLTQDILNLSASGGLRTDLNSLIIRHYPSNTKKAGEIYQLVKHLFPATFVNNAASK